MKSRFKGQATVIVYCTYSLSFLDKQEVLLTGSILTHIDSSTICIVELRHQRYAMMTTDVGHCCHRCVSYLCVLEVVPPEGADLVLTAHIPHGETNVLVLNSLHVKTCSVTEEQESISNSNSQRLDPESLV